MELPLACVLEVLAPLPFVEEGVLAFELLFWEISDAEELFELVIGVRLLVRVGWLAGQVRACCERDLGGEDLGKGEEECVCSTVGVLGMMFDSVY